MSTLILLVSFGLTLTTDLLEAGDFRVRVAAGDHPSKDSPVSVVVPVAHEKGFSARAISGDRQTPAQIEKIDARSCRVWWIVDDLAANASAEYRLEVGRIGTDKSPMTFGWSTSSKDGLISSDLSFGKRPVLRYMHTPFSLENKELSKKPFHHVFSPDGKQLITKGAGGLYPHHRGIYFGYSRCKVGGKSYDTWHAHNGEHEVHVEEIQRIEGPVVGGHVVRIHWNDRDGKTFARETRRLVAYRQSSGHHLIEFSSHLEVADGPVDLHGDPQHAGVQFRAAQFVAENQKLTRYLRPEKWKALPENKQINFPGNKEHKEMPWNAIRFKVADSAYTVAYLSDPRNPEGAQSSERLYGRFGEYIPFQLRKDKPLDLRYRWWIASSHDVSREDAEGRYQALASPPKVTLLK